MKKIVIIIFTLCFTMGMVSFSNDKKVDLQELISKAKKEGANWDEAQWKQAFRDVFTYIKPMLDWTKDVENRLSELEKCSDGAAKLAASTKIMEEAEAKEKEFEPLIKSDRRI